MQILGTCGQVAKEVRVNETVSHTSDLNQIDLTTPGSYQEPPNALSSRPDGLLENLFVTSDNLVRRPVGHKHPFVQQKGARAELTYGGRGMGHIDDRLAPPELIDACQTLLLECRVAHG